MNPSQRYLTISRLSEILAEYDWPDTYTIEDDMPDGIMVAFSRSAFYFVEESDGCIQIRFLPRDTKGHPGLHIGHALMVLAPNLDLSRYDTQGNGPFSSMIKVHTNVKTCCDVLLTYLRPVILGDFSWVDEIIRQQGI